ncbi:MAG: hypothetical protein AAF701_02595 [Pseudomonadota bacterium]
MTIFRLGTALAVCTLTAGCLAGLDADERRIDKTMDREFDAKPLTELKAGIWIDPNGCDHWIIDDGIEGYLSTRLQPNGKPVCTGHGAETLVYGDYQAGSPFVNSVAEKNGSDDLSPIVPRN